MRNQELHQKVLRRFVERLRQKQGDNLLKVVLFGSLARGENDPSDIDVFVLLKEAQAVSGKDVEDIVDISYEVDIDEGNCETYLSPFVRFLDDYQRGLQRGIPVYNAIRSEGRVLYDAQGQ